ncbi:MAG TPA: hypothetical protein VFP54_09995 [Acidimicrobiales bacterium]|nr:hypothetical protein [Acidimicrobiales bacterium]
MARPDLRDRHPTTGASRRPRGRGRPNRRRRRLVGALVLTVVTAAVLVVALRPRPGPPPQPACTAGVVAGGPGYTLAPDQAQNAAIIAAVAYRQGLPDHAVTVALATALQESGLHNLPYGDRDSVGLFQQRPSQGWGTRAQLLDPVYAVTAFYTALQKVAGWQSMAVTDAAQAVQQSADPSAYAGWEGQARTLAVALTGETPAALTCRLVSFSGPPPAPTALGAALSTEMGRDLLGPDLPAKTGWRVAAWVVAHAYAYHVRTVAFAGWQWQAASGRWRRSNVGVDPVTGGVVSVTAARA